MTNIERAAANPKNWGVRTTDEGVVGSIPIEGRSFVDCILMGSALVISTAETRFGNCNFGDVEGDVRNVLLTAAGTRVIGPLPVAGCVFERCLFHGVGLVGGEAVIAALVATVDVPTSGEGN